VNDFTRHRISNPSRFWQWDNPRPSRHLNRQPPARAPVAATQNGTRDKRRQIDLPPRKNGRGPPTFSWEAPPLLAFAFVGAGGHFYPDPVGSSAQALPLYCL